MLCGRTWYRACTSLCLLVVCVWALRIVCFWTTACLRTDAAVCVACVFLRLLAVWAT